MKFFLCNLFTFKMSTLSLVLKTSKPYFAFPSIQYTLRHIRLNFPYLSYPVCQNKNVLRTFQTVPILTPTQLFYLPNCRRYNTNSAILPTCSRFCLHKHLAYPPCSKENLCIYTVAPWHTILSGISVLTSSWTPCCEDSLPPSVMIMITEGSRKNGLLPVPYVSIPKHKEQLYILDTIPKNIHKCSQEKKLKHVPVCIYMKIYILSFLLLPGETYRYYTNNKSWYST